MVEEAKNIIEKTQLTDEVVRFGKPKETSQPIIEGLKAAYRKKIVTCTVKDNKLIGKYNTDRSTIFIDMETEVSHFLKF